MKEKAAQLISWWQTTGAVHEQDSRTRAAGKAAFRVFGILLLLVLSPILVIVLVFLAFVTVI